MKLPFFTGSTFVAVLSLSGLATAQAEGSGADENAPAAENEAASSEDDEKSGEGSEPAEETPEEAGELTEEESAQEGDAETEPAEAEAAEVSSEATAEAAPDAPAKEQQPEKPQATEPAKAKMEQPAPAPAEPAVKIKDAASAEVQQEAERRADPKRDQKAAEKLVVIEKAVEMRSYKPWEEAKDTTSDWVRLSSGEWLKGSIKELREGSVIFGSAGVGDQTIGWGSIADIHSPNSYIYVMLDQSVHTGTAELASEKLVIHTAAGPRVFEKSQVMTIVPNRASELSKWSFNLSVGATLRRGNTETVDYSATSRLRREDAFNRATLEYMGAYGLVSDERTTNKHRGTATWNIFLNPRFFVTPLLGSGEYDEFQNIEFRGIAGAGAGVHLITHSKFKMDFELGGAYSSTSYISVEDGEDSRIEGVLVIPKVVFDWSIAKKVGLSGTWYSSLMVTEIDQSFHHGDAKLAIGMTDIIDFVLSGTFDRVESPVTDDEGVTPEKDDVSVTAGLGLTL